MKIFISLFVLLVSTFSLVGQENYKTYCNPVNLDYTYMTYNAHNDLSYRSGADPAVVNFRDEYYMFVTRSMGYWHSTDLNNWEFIEPENWYFEGSNAPAAWNYKDSLLYVTGNPSGNMSLLYTDSPKEGKWEAVPAVLQNLQDPALFIDDDDQAYLYWGSSNKFPIRGKRLDMDKRFRPGEEVELFNLEPEKHGWERFGENHRDTIPGYIEGPWMTKHNGKYYLQYGAPGTQFNVYGDGVYVGDDPMGPFEYMPNNPFSYKPGGFMNGAGHSSTVEGPNDTWWHFGTMAVAVNIGWERRIGMFRTYFDEDDLMYSDTYFGDYPHFVPTAGENAGDFAGWMLLSFKKPVKASSVFRDPEGEEDYNGKFVVDEDVESFWIAEENNEEQWLEIDLEKPATIHAVQVNYNDYKSQMYGRYPDLYHRYTIEASNDGKNWTTIVDKSENRKDVPNDYVELQEPHNARYIRYNNINVPTPYLSISGLRVFGKGSGKVPTAVQQIEIDRREDRRDAMITWKKQPNAQGYNVFWGIAPDKLYNSWLVYDEGELELRSLSTNQTYYFAVEAFNENGVSQRSKPVKVE